MMFSDASFFISRSIFLRCLGIIYFFAFWSLHHQILGLLGKNGIVSIQTSWEILQEIAVKCEWGWSVYWRYPSLCWLAPDDFTLQFLCVAGQILSFFVILGVALVPTLTLLWFFYLSLTIAGSVAFAPFLSFQWDSLLLEVGFLSLFFAPLQLRPQKLSQETPPCPYVLFLLWWVLFRLTFCSGFLKIVGGDASWQNLTALTYHYNTQPLTPWTAWYLYQFPLAFHQLSVLVVLVIQLIAPLFLFIPQYGRLCASVAMIFLQITILLTGNYAFFNWLAIALCLLGIEDRYWKKSFDFLRRKPSIYVSVVPPQPINKPSSRSTRIAIGITFFIAFLGFLRGFVPSASQNLLFRPFLEVTTAFRMINSYGLFVHMTKQRPELIIEGSFDQKEWKAYEFRWKVGDVFRKPSFVAPYHPRLDWQMWFAALGNYKKNVWFLKLLQRLLQNEPETLALLEKNPFSEQPPRYLRVLCYDYQLSDFTTRKQTGAWWIRTYQGMDNGPIWTLTHLHQLLQKIHPKLP